MFIRSHFLHPDAPAAPAPPAIPPVTTEQKVNALTAQLLATHGTVENALRSLVLQSATTEQTIATLTAERDDLRAKLPKAGDVVIPKAEAVEYAKVAALNLKPDELVAKVKQADELQRKDSTRTLTDQARDAASAAGLDPEAFAALAQAKGLHIEMKDLQVLEKGKTVTKKVPHVRPAADDKAALVPVADYTKTLPAFEQRALQATVAPTTPVGSPWIPGQVPTPGSPVNSNATENYLNKRFAPRQPAGAAAS